MAPPDPGAASFPPPIDLRPLFAPASIAVIGASPRSSLALTVRDNLARMGSETRCHFVNPNYTEAFGQPCYPSLAALPERPDSAILAVNPLRAARFALEAAEAGVPSLVIPGGGVVEGGEPAAAMQRAVRGDCDPARGGAARPQLHGRGRLDDQQLHLHR